MKPLLAALFVLSAAPVFAQELPPNHPPLGGAQAQAAPATPAAAPSQSAEELLKQLDQTAGLKEKEKTFQVAASLGKLYYGQGRFADALVYLQQAADKAEPLRSFYVTQRKKALAQKLDLPNAETAGCAFGAADSVRSSSSSRRRRQRRSRPPLRRPVRVRRSSRCSSRVSSSPAPSSTTAMRRRH